MFVALDSDANRVYADSADKRATYYCPACNETLKLRRGSIKKPHFAHLPGTDCYYGRDTDYKSEWHIRMQEYFPRETREVRFVDEETGEIHIADVFITASNTVLEFQHSPISADEFISRTIFHLKNQRRIVWLFDESSEAGNSTFGRFRLEDDFSKEGRTYYKWMYRPRQILEKGPTLKEAYKAYCVCVFTGTEGDVFHRIVDQIDQFRFVAFSNRIIQMRPNLNIEQFFEYDSFWLKEYIDYLTRMKALSTPIKPSFFPQLPVRRVTQRRRRL